MQSFRIPTWKTALVVFVLGVIAGILILPDVDLDDYSDVSDGTVHVDVVDHSGPDVPAPDPPAHEIALPMLALVAALEDSGAVVATVAAARAGELNYGIPLRV